MSGISTQFKDTEGEGWTISLNVGSYMRINKEFQIDIGRVFDTNDNWIAELASQENIFKFIGIIEVCTEKQRLDRGLTLDEFHERLGGDTLEEATHAFIEAVVLFLPAHKQGALRAVVQAIDKGLKQTSDRVKEASQEMSEVMSAKIDKAMDEELKKLTSMD